MSPGTVLVLIKLAHTLAWAVLAGMILILPWYIVRRRWRAVTVLLTIVLIECAVLAVNGMRCPLTDLAEQYAPSANRPANFDIYLPAWLAHYNKLIFGTLFGFDLIWAAWRRWRPEKLSTAYHVR